jgi:hypothetical protein
MREPYVINDIVASVSVYDCQTWSNAKRERAIKYTFVLSVCFRMVRASHLASVTGVLSIPTCHYDSLLTDETFLTYNRRKIGH